jgi:hypothetical protein
VYDDEPMSNAKQRRSGELSLNRLLNLGIGLDVDVGCCLILCNEHELQLYPPIARDTYEDDDPAVLYQRSAESEKLLLAGGIVGTCPNVSTITK